MFIMYVDTLWPPEKSKLNNPSRFILTTACGTGKGYSNKRREGGIPKWERNKFAIQGGLDIAAMCGVFLGAAKNRIPVVIDGFISIVAALCAVKLCPNVKDYLIASHASFEPGYVLAMKELGLEAPLLMGMRLGEGSGCPIMFRVLDAAFAIMNEMATFDEASIDDSYLDEIREGDHFTVKR